MATVERLTLVSDVVGEFGPVHFDPAVFLSAGDAFWMDGFTLYIRAPDGAVRQVQGSRRGRQRVRKYLAFVWSDDESVPLERVAYMA
ncbi:MAG: hypothetical protein M3353_04410, partial [Actinomycetota bacterium]|nr:hypothetical protein [Actinomycetota bacterium]